MNTYYVYILASQPKGTLYIGVTNNLVKRAYQHKHDQANGFTQKYRVHQLMYYETYQEIHEALKSEKQLKKWKRQWKIELIEKNNPTWKDIFKEII